ncbi:MAG: flavin reductase [Actinobacteria bacterium]|nr:flavin reductase [Actinomycetota bacterium]
MVIVTAAADGENAGCLVGFTTQCSIDPPRFLVFLSEKNRTHEVARRADRLAVHFLDDADHALAELFGGETGDNVDKFSRCRWHAVDGAPVLDDAERWFVGRVVDRYERGDHGGHLLEPISVAPAPGPRESEGDLSYQDVREMEPGHEP